MRNLDPRLRYREQCSLMCSGQEASTFSALRFNRTGWLMICFVLIMGSALLFFGWEDAVVVVTRLTLVHIAILCILTLLHYAVRILRWHILVRANGIHCGFWPNALHLLGGFALTTTPGRLGELFRLRWLQHETGHSFSRLLPAAIADRAIELGSMLLLIIAMLALTNLNTNAVWGLLALAALLVVVSCSPHMLEACLTGLWRLIGRRKPRVFAKLRRIIHNLQPIMRPVVLVPVLMIGVLGWAFEGVAFWLLLGWLDLELSLPLATCIFLVSILAGALSGLPGGFGGAEATGVALLVLQSVPVESAVLAVLIIRLTTLWFAVLIGLVAFPVAEAHSRRVRNGNAHAGS